MKLGKNVKIYPQVYVGDGCEIGDDSVLRSGVKVYEGCRIGSRCILHSGAVIGADGFGFAPHDGKFEKLPQTGIVEICDDVEIGANTTIDRATFGSTVIGEGTKARQSNTGSPQCYDRQKQRICRPDRHSRVDAYRRRQHGRWSVWFRRAYKSGRLQ